MDLKQLRAFVDVADVGSLTRAAILRGTAQSALSKLLGGLEAEFRGKLFHRTGRGVVPTELGRAILPRAKALLLQAEQLHAEVQAGPGAPFGQVVVGLQSSSVRPLASLLYRRTRERFPGITLRIVEGFSGHIEEWLAIGRADIGVLNRYGPDPSRQYDPLLDVALCLVGRAGDAAMRKRRIGFASLASVPLALPGLPNGLRLMLDEAARSKGIALSVAIEVDSLTVIKDLAADGSAYTILPLHAVFDEVQAGRLAAAPLCEPALGRSLVIATGRHRPPTRAVREVERVIRQLVAELIRSGTWK